MSQKKLEIDRGLHLIWIFGLHMHAPAQPIQAPAHIYLHTTQKELERQRQKQTEAERGVFFSASKHNSWVP